MQERKNYHCHICHQRTAPYSQKYPIWSPKTHYIFSKECKKVVLTLLFILKKEPHVFCGIPKDVLFLIISYVMPCGEKIERKGSPCDDCLYKITAKPQCTACIKEYSYSFHSFPDDIYLADDDGSVFYVPNICRKCNVKQIYTCSIHNDIEHLCEYCIMRD